VRKDFFSVVDSAIHSSKMDKIAIKNPVIQKRGGASYIIKGL